MMRATRWATATALLAAVAIGSAHGAEDRNAAAARAATPHVPPRIRVVRPDFDTSTSERLRAAHSAFQAGDVSGALHLYEEIARIDPKNVDALLGLGALAARRGDRDAASTYYLRVLGAEPRNATAQGAMLALFGIADRAETEIRLKALVAREPSAFLYSSLGQLYAGQSLWLQAQDAYFEAYRLAPEEPDHAYNLAVALEHIGRHELALRHYRRALALAGSSKPARFDIARTEDRVTRLAAIFGSR